MARRNRAQPTPVRRRGLELTHPNAAGVDIGSASHYVAVPADRDDEPVREFASFTADLNRLADWLTACGVDTVAMESTGVYWIPLFELLDARGFTVLLVNARHVKNVSGRKSDVLDCQWLQQLHSYGLLHGAFRPDAQICELRSYLRQRAMLIRYGAQHIQHMQKALTQMNVQLHHVIRDITGKTGMAILRAIVAGERDSQQLARLRDGRCTNDEATIARGLDGHWRADHLFELRQALELYDVYQQKIAACERQIESLVRGWTVDRPDGPVPERARKRQQYYAAFSFDAHSLLYRLTGVDLTRIDGIDTATAFTVIAEIGLDMTRWPSAKHFSSWLGLCPGTKVSGGKLLNSRSRPSASRAAAARRLAGQTLLHSRSALGAFARRMRARLGAPKAITAAARKLATLVYSMLRYGTDYVDRGEQEYEARYRDRVVRSLVRRANALGFQLVPQPVGPHPAPGPV